jgi:hypothetical protein
LIGTGPTELLLHRSLDSVLGSGSLNGVLGHHFATTTSVAAVAAAVAAIATVAAIAAMATITTVAAIAAVATAAAVARIAAAILRRAAAIAVATTMLAAVAAAAIIRAAIAATAAGEETGLSRILAANQGDAHEGKKRRHTEHNNAVHPRILQLLTGTVSRNT